MTGDPDAVWRARLDTLDPQERLEVRWRFRTVHGIRLFSELSDVERAAWFAHVDRRRADTTTSP